jgi:uncharacterized membrane protein YphA (DoxX/SURF4 family)
MNTWTRIGLVLLRVAIGWHFLFEGIEKLDSWYYGPREGKPVWSAAGYLRESQGPLGGWFRSQAPDADGDMLNQLTMGMPKEPPKTVPETVIKQWEKQFDAFVAHYELGSAKALQPEHVGYMAMSPLAPALAAVPWPAIARSTPPGEKAENLQLRLAKADFALAKERAQTWLIKGDRMVPSKLPKVDEKVKETTVQRLALYRKKLDALQEIETKGMPAFDHDAWKDEVRTLKKDIEKLRVDLLQDLNKPIKDTMTVAGARLSNKQVKSGPVPTEYVAGTWLDYVPWKVDKLAGLPAPDEPVATTNLDRINFVTRWGVTLVGACLMLGLFTRTSCVVGAGFLLMFYLAMPSLPWLPLNPRAEGHYLFINKNIIEMIALLALATTPSGKWLGLDGLIQFLNPFRKRGARQADRPAVAARAA